MSDRGVSEAREWTGAVDGVAALARRLSLLDTSDTSDTSDTRSLMPKTNAEGAGGPASGGGSAGDGGDDLAGALEHGTFRVPPPLLRTMQEQARFHGVPLGDLIAYAFWRLWQVETESQEWSEPRRAAWMAEVRAWANQSGTLGQWVSGWRAPLHSGRLGVSSATERRITAQRLEPVDNDHES